MTFSPPPSTDASPSTQLPLWPEIPADRAWRVRISERARQMSIRVYTGGQVEIVVPRWARGRAVEQFVRRHQRWVERKIAQSRARAPALLERIPSSIDLASAGERWRVLTRAEPGAVRLRRMDCGTIELSGDCSDAAELQRVLQSWLIERAREVLVPWLQGLAAQTGLEFKRTQIRRQRSRWGSCSVRGTVSLNCCLLFQRPEVVRYLLLHELCHTQHMNHSRRFWQLVAAFEPNHRALDRELLDGWQNVPAWVFGT
jgi:predicted metal-dependent hydrolase